MAHPHPIRRLLDAGLQLTELTQSNAERIVSELVKAGEVRRKDGEKMVRELLEHNREAGERFRAAVRDEVARQMGGMAGRLEQVETLMGQLVTRLTPGAPTARPAPPAEKAPAKKSPAKKAPARKSSTNKRPAKKAAPVSSAVGPVTATARPDTAD